MTALYGRQDVLAHGDAFLTSSAAAFSVLLLEGEPGIGKTTVWQEIAARARERGFRVLTCRPAATETKLALSAVTDLLDTVAGEVLDRLPEPQRHALEVALLRVGPGARPPLPRTLATATRSLIAHLARRSPLLVAVDDAQWLDPASAAVLAFALRRGGDTTMGWLFARRLSQAGGLAPENLVPDPALRRIFIGSLPPADLHRVLADRIDVPISRPLLLRIHEVTGGSPLYALELTRAGALASGKISVPPDLRRLLTARVHELPVATRAALLMASALSVPTTTFVDLEALAPAESADLVSVDASGRITFRHPLVASAVYETAPRSQRQQVHQQLAQLVDDLEERARHLAAATTAPAEGVAAAIENGAALARARGAWNSAAELLERAHHLTPADLGDEAARRGLSAAEHHVHAGDRRRARALLERMLEGDLPGPLRADSLRLLGEISYNDANFAEAERLFTEALAATDDARLRATIELGLSYVGAYLLDFPRCAVSARRALALAEQAGDEPLIAEAMGQTAMYDFLCGRGVDWSAVQRALALEDPERLVPLQSRPTVVHALLLLYVGRHAEARDQLEGIRAAALERGDDSDVAFVLLWSGWLETRMGHLDAAAALAEDAATLASLVGSESVRAWALMQRALVSAHRGDIVPTRADCAEAAALASRLGYTMPTIWIAASLAILELSLGNPAAAWDACASLTSTMAARGIGEPVPAFFWPDAVEALITMGRLEEAETLLSPFEARARALDRAWGLANGGRCRGLLLAAQGNVALAETVLKEALSEHDRIDAPFDRARTLLVDGSVKRRLRKPAQARASWEASLELFAQVGARLWTERARRELDRLGLRRTVDGELTLTEARVARLAARGLSNREAAAALFISPKTVEAHLARIYRKLGIRSRAELGAHIGRREPS